MILNYQKKIFFQKNGKILMILNYQKKFFFKKTINFNDFKLSKKNFFQKNDKF